MNYHAATSPSITAALPTLVCLIFGSIVFPANTHAQEGREVLAEYVTRPDDSFTWGVRQRTRLASSDCIELTLTSQTWRDMVWKHRLFLIVPDNVKNESDGVLVIEGGRWKEQYEKPMGANDAPDYPKEAVLLAGLAQQMQAPIAILLNVPRQPIFEGRTEDEIIAYTFDKFLDSGDTDWPLLLPMVKSAVRAMDAVQSFASEDLSLDIGHFTVAGASKRGWTTWLTAAVDQRVHALAPMVIDMLNLHEQFPHQFNAWGEYSQNISDYSDIDLQRRVQSPRGDILLQIVDPYSYREAIKQPKVIFLGTNDGFWTVDALNLYWESLSGPKYIVYVPNADHDLAKDWQRVLGGINGLHQAVSGNQPLPQLEWDYEPTSHGVKLAVDPAEAGSQVAYWSALSETRDFRNAKWTSTTIGADAGGKFAVDIPQPREGYRAIYAEITYSRGLIPLKLATTVMMLEPFD